MSSTCPISRARTWITAHSRRCRCCCRTRKSGPARWCRCSAAYLNPPIPSPLRFYKFGLSLRKAIESYPEDIKVCVVGTGGLSHQVHGERCGFNNTPWDMEFLERLEKDPEGLTKVTIAEYAKLGGMEGAEVVMWLLMRGALSKKVKKLHQTYYLPSMTPICSVIFENDSDDPVTETVEKYRARMTQYRWPREARGHLSLYTIERSVKAFRLNRFLHETDQAGIPQAVPAIRSRCSSKHKLTERGARPGAPARLARADPLRRDLLPAGKAGSGDRHHQPAHLCGHARPVAGGFPEDTQCAGALSVAGQDEGKTDWDKKPPPVGG